MILRKGWGLVSRRVLSRKRFHGSSGQDAVERIENPMKKQGISAGGIKKPHIRTTEH
jgi:hypothetical protein